MKPLVALFASPMWRWPTWLGLLTAAGLLCALLADGWIDALSSIALGLPVAVAMWHGWIRS